MNTPDVSHELEHLRQILESSAQADSSTDQVTRIVDGISQTLGTDVCSLYKLLDNGSLLLLASHGLSAAVSSIVPANQGLIGHVARTQHILNIKHPEQHPDYFYLEHSQEERFHSFCGVPVVHRGMVIGVLVVQRREAKEVSSSQEAILITLATHLALLMVSIGSVQDSGDQQSTGLGICGAPGLALGKAYVRRDRRLSDVQMLSHNDISAEFALWNGLRELALDEIRRERQLIHETMGEGLASVMDAYQLLLCDPAFEQKIREHIQGGYHLPWALKQGVAYYSSLFKAMDDAYLRARHEDIEHLGEKLYQLWLDESAQAPPSFDDAIILIGQQVSISDIAKLATERLAGIVCTAGASLSHIAVFANALGIPAVMGVGQLAVKDGDLVVVDGDTAQVLCAPSSHTVEEYQRLIDERRLLSEHLLAQSELPANTLDHTRITLFANTGLQADVKPGLRYGAEGIGLYRTEIPFMVRSSLPSENEQELIYRDALAHYAGKPVYMRTLDVGSDKCLPYMPIVNEDNPALGWRGIRYTLDNQTLFNTQLRAILRAAIGSEQLHLLLPMISSSEQLDQALSMIDDAVEELCLEGQPVTRPKIGVMVEVPACIDLLPYWQDKLDFVSIGTNDLSQYLLAIDRNNPLVGKWYDALHPSVLQEVDRAASTARSLGLPVSVCGELASDPVAVVFLIGMGITQLSMSAARIPLIKSLVRAVSVYDAQQLLSNARQLDRASAIRDLGNQYLNSLPLDSAILRQGTKQ